jgi:hypothetical protein
MERGTECDERRKAKYETRNLGFGGDLMGQAAKIFAACPNLLHG